MVDIQNLNDAQKAADAFFRSKIPNLSSAALAAGEQNGKYFKYQYLSQNAPITMTQVAADRVDETNNKFKLIDTIQSVSGPVQGGRLTSVAKSYAIESFEKALENLDWD